jgi:hypothetical protein
MEIFLAPQAYVVPRPLSLCLVHSRENFNSLCFPLAEPSADCSLGVQSLQCDTTSKLIFKCQPHFTVGAADD